MTVEIQAISLIENLAYFSGIVDLLSILYIRLLFSLPIPRKFHSLHAPNCFVLSGLFEAVTETQWA